jgi:hypothetical protein
VWRKPAFGEENDGIVCTGASAIGFALLENIIYVARQGLDVGAAWTFSAIPLHVFTAVLVGLHVGRARFIASRPARTGLVLRGCAVVRWGSTPETAAPAAAATRTPGVMVPEAVLPAVPPETPRAAQTHRWMPVISRLLLAASALFWILLIA